VEGKVEEHPNSNSKGVNQWRNVRVHAGRERNLLIPVGLILIYIMSQVLGQHTMVPLNTPL
jgi:hypothetical protein